MKLKNRGIDEICAFMASRVRAERRRLGLTQEEMALSVGISVRTYKRYEGTGHGSIRNLVKIIKALDRLLLLELFFPAPLAAKSSVMARFKEIAEAAGRKKGK